MGSRTVKRPFLRLAMLLAFAALSCGMAQRTLADSEIKKDDKPSYAERIIAIDKRDPEPIKTDFLIGDEVLVELASEGAEHIDDCIEFLAAEDHTWQQRQVAILSMYKLSRPDYVTFLRKMMDLLDRHRVSVGEFNRAVMPSY